MTNELALVVTPKQLAWRPLTTSLHGRCVAETLTGTCNDEERGASQPTSEVSG